MSHPKFTSRRLPGLMLAGLLLWLVAPGLLTGLAVPGGDLVLHGRSRVESAGQTGQWSVVEKDLRWAPKQTAIVVCDMWDRHWCKGATERVAEMAPRMNEVLKAARTRGVLIVHAPSETMKNYADYPQRKRAEQAPQATAPTSVNQWKSLNQAKEPPLPIDDSDGGCDDQPQCAQGMPWRSEIATLEIAPADVISDNGAEVYNVLQQAGIENVIVMGVHANMCVLGRPFSIRAMVGLGKHVVLMRDLTDTMYNSRRRPYVSHFAGTDLVVEHIEKYWCPSITSADLVGGEPFHFQADRRPSVVMMIGEDEYHTWETLPAFAKKELGWRGLNVTVVQEDKTAKNDFPGLVEALRGADVLVLSVRRRSPPRKELDAVRAYLAAGRPLVGIRTACHAFALGAGDRRNRPATLAEWPEFDPEVLGGNYHGHYGAGPVAKIVAAPGSAEDSILTGVKLEQFVGHGSLYRCGPLKADAKPLLFGAIAGEPAEPVAWTRAFGPKQARIFYTSLGHPDDFADPQFRRLLLNAILWAAGQPLPPAE